MVEPLYAYQFRLILIGDSTVGKSCLLKCYTEGTFEESCEPTVGVDFFVRVAQIEPNVRIKLQLWDTAGQEKFRSITYSYYRNSVGVMIVYDITRRETFEHVAAWLHEARRNTDENICVCQLIGHKSDLESQRQVLYEEGEYFAKYHKMKFVETSAKNGQNVEEAFSMLAREIYARIKASDRSPLVDGWEGVKPGITDAVTLMDDQSCTGTFGLCSHC